MCTLSFPVRRDVVLMAVVMMRIIVATTFIPLSLSLRGINAITHIMDSINITTLTIENPARMM